MAEVKQTFTGDASQLEAEYKKLEKAANSQADKLDWIAKQADRAADAQGKASKAAAKGYELAAKEAGKSEVANRHAARAAEELARAGVKGAKEKAAYYRQEAEFAAKSQQALLNQARAVAALAAAEAEAAKVAKRAAADREAAQARWSQGMARMAEQNDKWKQGLAKLAGSQGRGPAGDFKEQSEGLADLTMKATGYLLAWTSISKAMSEVKRHMEDIKNAQENALNASVGIAASQAQAILNAPGRSPKATQKYFSEISRIQKETGFGGGPEGSGRRYLEEALNRTQSVTSADDATSLAAVKQAANLTVNNPQQLQELAPSIASLMQNFNMPEEKAASLILKFGMHARPANLGDQAKMAERAMITGQTTSPKDPWRGALASTALTAALSKFADDEGDTSSTSAINLDVSLMEFFKKGYDKKFGDKTVHFPLKDPGSTEGRIAALRANKGLADEFDSNAAAFGRKRFKMPFYQIITGGKFEKYYQDTLADLESDKNVAPQAAYDVRNATPQLKASTAFNRAKVASEQNMLGDARKTTWAQALKNVEDARSQTGDSVWTIDAINSRIADTWRRATYESPAAYEENSLRQRRSQLDQVARDPVGRFLFPESAKQAERSRDFLDERLKKFERVNRSDLPEGDPRRAAATPPAANTPALIEEQQKQTGLLGMILQALLGNPADRAPGLAPAARSERGTNREK